VERFFSGRTTEGVSPSRPIRTPTTSGGDEDFAVENSLVEAKSRLRAELNARRKALPPGDAEDWSARICGWLAGLPVVDGAGRVVAYAATPGEVSLKVWIENRQKCGKGVLLPRFDSLRGDYVLAPVRDWEGDTIAGRFGIREPRPDIGALEPGRAAGGDVVWLVPGLGFDRTGGRLGRGRGYYDRLLREVRGLKIGVAFSWQVLPEIPAGSDDIRMDLLATETGIVPCSPAGDAALPPQS
jgi:5-formyltetrahydrofolate cyclo-ligase